MRLCCVSAMQHGLMQLAVVRQYNRKLYGLLCFEAAFCRTCSCSAALAIAAVEDVSPPRKRSKAGEELASSDEAGVGSRKPRFMADGSRAGQVSGAELAKELATKAQREAKEFAALGASVTGRGADTVSTRLIKAVARVSTACLHLCTGCCSWVQTAVVWASCCT